MTGSSSSPSSPSSPRRARRAAVLLAGLVAGCGSGAAHKDDAATCVLVDTELLQNPDFDSTPVAWTQDTRSRYPLITPPPVDVQAQSAPNVAWEGGSLEAQDGLYQDVVIPADATSITFSFSYAIGTEETEAVPYDEMSAYVFDAATQQGTPLVQFSNVDASVSTTWKKYSVDIPLSWAGRTAQFGFNAQTDNVNNTNFFIDNASVTVAACP
jgi:hypothetical protein